MAISNINNPDVVNINPSGVIRATGGTITQISESGINYTVHTFTSSGALIFMQVVEMLNIWLLVVAGLAAGLMEWVQMEQAAVVLEQL
jgi:hypothetical protein